MSTSAEAVIVWGGASARIAAYGAHVLSWLVNGEEQLFLSKASSTDGPGATRGGIPICFPVFGPPPKREPFLKLKQHGFARTVMWSSLGISQDKNSAWAKFGLSSNSPQVKQYDFPAFECFYIVTLTDRSLSTELQVTNRSQAAFDFQALLHTYLLLPTESSPQNVKLKPLKGLTYIDKAVGGSKGVDEREELDFRAGEVDRVYEQVPDELEVNLGQGKLLKIKTSGLPNLTVWNPHQAKSDAMADMEKDGWTRFVCVEPGQTSLQSLNPGQTWIGKQTLILK